MRSLVLKDKADKDKDKYKANEVFCPDLKDPQPTQEPTFPVTWLTQYYTALDVPQVKKFAKTFPMKINSSVLFGFPSPALSLQLALSEGHNIVRVKTD